MDELTVKSTSAEVDDGADVVNDANDGPDVVNDTDDTLTPGNFAVFSPLLTIPLEKPRTHRHNANLSDRMTFGVDDQVDVVF